MFLRVFGIFILVAILMVGVFGTQADAYKDDKIKIKKNLESDDIKKVKPKTYDKVKKHDIESFSGMKNVIIYFKGDLDEKKINKLLSKNVVIKTKFKIIPAVAASVDQKFLDKVKNDVEIDYVYEDFKMSALLDQSIPQIEADLVHAVPKTGSGVKVCVIDSGVDYTHPSLASNMWVNPGEIPSNGIDDDSNGYVDDVFGYDFINNDGDPFDDFGHGTHVAGIIASTDSTFRGVAPGTSIMAVKVLNFQGSGNASTVISGIQWCVTNGADIISMSLGGNLFFGACDSEIDAIASNNAVDSGIVVISAAGNEGSYNQIAQPACASKVISVGAVTNDDLVADFSNRNSELDLVGPGVDIYSTVPTGSCFLCDPSGFLSLDGTSMATPHVSGVAALIIETDTNLSPIQVRTLLRSSANDLGCQLFDPIYGYGRVNANRAYLSASGLGISPTPPPLANGPTINGALYSISQADDKLRRINSIDGCTLSQLQITLTGKTVLSGTGLAAHPSTGELWALLNILGQSGRELVKVDEATGTATSIGNTGRKLAGITFDDSGNLYGIHGDNFGQGGTSQAALYSINTNTASTTKICDFLPASTDIADAGEALSYNPSDASLYRSSGWSNVVFQKLNGVSSCSGTNIALSNPFIGETNALLTFSQSPDEFFWVQGFTGNNLFRVTSSGTVQHIGTFDVPTKGLAITPLSVCGVTFSVTSVAHGELSEGETGQEILVTVTNPGSIPILVSLSGTDWINLDSSEIIMPESATRFSLGTPTGASYDLKTPLSSSPQSIGTIPAFGSMDMVVQLRVSLTNPLSGQGNQNLLYEGTC